ncbi:hypothetical protein D9619_003849 [Psilocybe cf. subviscida]|uniref:HAM1-like N-terminal domain-containing protein n=1 Tax=Psilocybe cf. subviscida TaxID=2480587 RepID=A0A8H5AY11_9AGAR|nr:hypothetical protein D9619_003849 [Psilocybe cf. subviscida]
MRKHGEHIEQCGVNIFPHENQRSTFTSTFQRSTAVLRRGRVSQQFNQDWARLTRYLLCYFESVLKFNPELCNDILRALLCAPIEELGLISISHVEYTDEGLDLDVEGSKDGTPCQTLSLLMRRTTSISARISNMRDVESYHRISGHKFKDWGAAGVVLDGDRTKSSAFKVDPVNIKVSILKFAILDSNYDFLYKTI